MRDEHLTHQDLFGETPENFTLSVEHTLNGLTEERSMKKGISGILIIALVLLLLCAAAFAAVQGGGLDWFYKHIFHIPTLPKDVDQQIQNDIHQTVTEDHPLLNLKVESAVWLPKDYDMNYPDERTLEILFSASPKDPDRYEVHPWQDLNGDGDHGEDTLGTGKGTGPIREMMTDPLKSLLLFGTYREDLLTMPGAMGVAFSWSFCHHTYDDAGSMLCYFSFHMSDSMIEHMRKYADKDGMVSLLYTDYSWLWNEQGDTYGHTQKGSVSFQIKLPE